MTTNKQAWDELPPTITTYLAAHEAKNATTAITSFTADAVVTDEGNTYRGRDEIGDWLRNAASEFTFTTEFVSATTSEAGHVDVLQHLEGDFPGGVADLHFRFIMNGALVSRLVIEP
ncbi:nuclear transport factor 2 family protein [Mycobacterium sp. NPDC051804]|uniref:nuclear transport factor 2 family protein n=1 Tax=Mycobacterium sp. NPDC051804 TaxID=3364295 RepID=UPI00379CA9DB